MPQPALHVAIARRALRRWQDHRVAVPFPIDDAACVNAFLHGSLGPDTGLFPGGLREMSRLAHSEATGALARTLLRLARTPAQRAFACGWASHVIADVEIHPLVNDAGRRLPDGPLWTTPQLRHITVEVGLDAWWLHRSPGVQRTRLRPALDAHGIALLVRAYDEVHGVRLDRAEIAKSHRRLAFWYNTYLRLARWLGEEQRQHLVARLAGARAKRHPVAVLRRILTPLLPAHVAAIAFLNAQPPTRVFVERTRAGILRHDLWLDRHLTTRLDELPDYDLETGQRLDGFQPSFFIAAG